MYFVVFLFFFHMWCRGERNVRETVFTLLEGVVCCFDVGHKKAHTLTEVRVLYCKVRTSIIRVRSQQKKSKRIVGFFFPLNASSLVLCAEKRGVRAVGAAADENTRGWTRR